MTAEYLSPDGFTREQLIEMVQLLTDGGLATERETDDLVLSIERNLPDPNVGDMLFGFDGPEMTAEEIVDRALAYRAIDL